MALKWSLVMKNNPHTHTRARGPSHRLPCLMQCNSTLTRWQKCCLCCCAFLHTVNIRCLHVSHLSSQNGGHIHQTACAVNAAAQVEEEQTGEKRRFLHFSPSPHGKTKINVCFLLQVQLTSQLSIHALYYSVIFTAYSLQLAVYRCFVISRCCCCTVMSKPSIEISA